MSGAEQRERKASSHRLELNDCNNNPYIHRIGQPFTTATTTPYSALLHKSYHSGFNKNSVSKHKDIYVPELCVCAQMAISTRKDFVIQNRNANLYTKKKRQWSSKCFGADSDCECVIEAVQILAGALQEVLLLLLQWGVLSPVVEGRAGVVVGACETSKRVIEEGHGFLNGRWRNKMADWIGWMKVTVKLKSISLPQLTYTGT